MIRQAQKLCIIDLNFTWPPDGGAPVDVHEIAQRFSAFYDTTLIVPHMNRVNGWIARPWPLSRTKFFKRGDVRFSAPPPYKLDVIDIPLSALGPETLTPIIEQRVAALRPDFVFVADGWYLKPYIVTALKKFRPALRLYAHEMMCLKGNGLLYRNGKVCDVDFLDGTEKSRKTCTGCATKFYFSFPSPRWLVELWKSRAFSADYQKLCMEAFRSAGTVLVGNRFIAGRLAPHLNVPVIAAGHGVDTERFAPKSGSLGNRIMKILLLGRLDMESKGFPVALEACRKIWKSRQDFRLCVSAVGKIPDEPFIEKLPWVPHEKVNELYRHGDLLLVPSIWPDPFPIVTLEAMASGLPVIASDVGGLPEQVENGATGRLVPPGDAGALAEAITWMLDHRDKTAEMGRRGRIRAVENFSWDNVFDRYYRNLFDQR